MNRKLLKKEAKKNLKRNYFKTILVIFIVGLVVNTGYTYVSNTNINKNTKETIHSEKTSTYDTMEKFFNNININIKLKSDKKRTKGVAAPIVNRIAEGKSPIIYLLNSLDLIIFKDNINGGIISLIVTLIVLINYFFIQRLIKIGNNRYFLEARRYNKTKIDKILYPYKTKRIPHLAIIMFIRELKLFLWGLTIIGGIIKNYEYSMIPYLLAENPNMSRKDVFKLSKELTKGYKWELFKLDISLIGWYILSIFTFGLLDLLFTDGYKEFIYAEFYMNRRKDNKKDYKYLLIDDKLDIKNQVDDIYPEIIKGKRTKNIKDFNRNYKLSTYILFFFTFAFIGWVYEVVLHLITDGEFVNRGTMFGPWLPIYGFGVVFILFILKPFRKNYFLYFIAAVILAAILEYSTAWYLETFLHKKWWDYSGYFLNIHGRICFEGLLVFGLGGCVITYLIAPLLDDLYLKIKPKIRIVICTLLILLFGMDIVYSYYHPNTGKGITDYEKR